MMASHLQRSLLFHMIVRQSFLFSNFCLNCALFLESLGFPVALNIELIEIYLAGHNNTFKPMSLPLELVSSYSAVY